MLWCRFSVPGHEVAYGLVEGEQVTRIQGSIFGVWERTSHVYALSAVELDVPVVPGNFYAIGFNYAAHVEERGKVRGTGAKYYDAPRVGYRANSALLPHGKNIVKPIGSGPDFQYEAELVAVIGKRARRVSPVEARDCIFGWTIGNDVTERDWQKKDPTNLRGKNADTFKPMGPFISTDCDLSIMRTQVFLNGKKLHDFATGNMLFDAGTVISAISQTNTLHPGDVVWLGTDELPQNMVPGDKLDITITGIGTLTNAVVAEQE